MGYKIFLGLLFVISKSESLVMIPECFQEITSNKPMWIVKIKYIRCCIRGYRELKTQTPQKLCFSSYFTKILRKNEVS